MPYACHQDLGLKRFADGRTGPPPRHRARNAGSYDRYVRQTLNLPWSVRRRLVERSTMALDLIPIAAMVPGMRAELDAAGVMGQIEPRADAHVEGLRRRLGAHPRP